MIVVRRRVRRVRAGVLVAGVVRCLRGTQDGQYDGQKYEAVEKTEDHGQEKYLKKDYSIINVSYIRVVIPIFGLRITWVVVLVGICGTR